MSHGNVSKEEIYHNGATTENLEGGIMDPQLQAMRAAAGAGGGAGGMETVTIPKVMFDKMFGNGSPTQLRTVMQANLGNPTPLALMGFLVASSSLGCSLMGWRGAGGGGAAVIGTFYFFGGMLQVIGAILEWSLGNTFISVVFATYGSFWIMMGCTLTPYFNAEGAYTNGLTGEALAAGQSQFYNSFSFAILWVAMVNMYFTICSFRTNVVLVLIFFFIEVALLLVCGYYWVLAEGRVEEAARLQVAAGAFTFVFCVFGWYLELHLLLTAVDFPYNLPVFDLSHIVKGASELKKDQAERQV